MKSVLGVLGTLAIIVSPLFTFFRELYAQTKKIVLPKETKRESLVNKNPSELDARNLDTTPP